jgi:hypothetical protein
MGSIIVTVAVSVFFPAEAGGLAAEVDGFSVAPPPGLPTSGSSATVIFSASRVSCSTADVEGLDSENGNAIKLYKLKI